MPIRSGRPGPLPRSDGDVSLLSLLFRAGPLLCAMPLSDVVETMRPLPTRRPADCPPYLRGISIVRGVPVPVVTAAALLAAGDRGGVDHEAAPDGADTVRFITVRSRRGVAAVATGAVVGVWEAPTGTAPDGTGRRPPDAGPVTAVTVRDGEPLLLVRGASLVPDAAWAVLEGGGTG